MLTEKEKMLQGLIYDAGGDEDLIAERRYAKDLCYDYNMMRPSLRKERRELIKKLFGSVKGDVQIEQPFWCDYGYNIHVGENFYMNHGCIILDGAPVTFGDNVFIAPGCHFYTAGHPLNRLERAVGLEFAYPITVGNDVWFGGGVLVMPGVTIGNNVVIGAGSVVTKDIPDNVIAAGNPCKVVRNVEDQTGQQCHHSESF